ncbi:MAG: Ni/Fe hydrogenase subunit alpha [Sedimentisphaerales bacterium]|nr:Ni/Fe hydrogenase subunit alpha [Sedimentisphaerales bacterium]
MSKRITINPITRLEGHGKIEIFLNDAGDVERAFLQVPELRGFETFSIGRPAEEMPRITPRICGVCPTAHHMASTKCLDSLWHVEPTSTAKKLRELVYSAFMIEDHYLHFYFLGGPDFVVGPGAPAAERNILGVIGKVGVDVASEVIRLRRECRQMMETMAGKVIHPVFGLPGGVSRGISEEERQEFLKVAENAIQFAQFSLNLFDDVVLKNEDYVNLVLNDAYAHKTNYMGLVDKNNKVNFYEGDVRVVSPEGKEIARFAPRDYMNHIAEHVEPWSYITFPYLKNIGWKGFTDGADSGVVRSAPLARCNTADGMATPLAQAAYEKMYETLGGKPAHATLAFHWARLVEAQYAAERMKELLEDDEITSDDIRAVPTETPDEGVGIVEAPRGTLIHHYFTDDEGILTKVNLIVATNFNAAPIAMSVEKAAQGMIKGGKVNDGLLNMVEMAFRAYDPCHACATHSLPGQMPLIALIHDSTGKVIQEIRH